MASGRHSRFSLALLRHAGRLVFVAWVFVAFAAATSLAAAHFYTLPRPATSDARVQRAIASHRSAADAGRWRVLHVLYAECRCSQRILGHLAERGPIDGVSETIVLVGGDPAVAADAVGAGFALDTVTPEELVSEYALEAAPALVVADPSDEVRYLGGYTERKQGPDIRDVSIIDTLRRDGSTDELPLFGCAVSESLQALLDPLALRYSRDD